MIPSWARVGVKVVCIDDRTRVIVYEGLLVELGGLLPVKGQVYTIRAVEHFTSPLDAIGSFLGVHLVEIDRPPGAMSGRVVPYRLSRFRPLVEDTNDGEVEARIFKLKHPFAAFDKALAEADRKMADANETLEKGL